MTATKQTAEVAYAAAQAVTYRLIDDLQDVLDNMPALMLAWRSIGHTSAT